MQGMAIYRVVRRHLPDLVQATLADAGLTLDDVARVIPHQASGRALDLMIPAVGVHHAKVVRVHDAFGNCVAASLPMALAMAHETGELRRGDRALLIGTGAGVSLAAAVLTW
jgi:3-oxoacyl-[acyl-carrier-protein] synthase-3